MTSLLSHVEKLDVRIFFLINQGLSCGPLDLFFSFVTELKNYALPGGLLTVYLWTRKGLRGRLCLLNLVLCVGLSDGLSSRLIKPWVHRLRPCTALPHVLIPHGDRGTFSSPSSHAVNIAGAMLILALSFPAWTASAAMLAIMVGLSRVYLGLHYPTDVLAGYLIGGVIGWASWQSVGLAQARWRTRPPAPISQEKA